MTEPNDDTTVTVTVEAPTPTPDPVPTVEPVIVQVPDNSLTERMDVLERDIASLTESVVNLSQTVAMQATMTPDPQPVPTADTAVDASPEPTPEPIETEPDVVSPAPREETPTEPPTKEKPASAGNGRKSSSYGAGWLSGR